MWMFAVITVVSYAAYYVFVFAALVLNVCKHLRRPKPAVINVLWYWSKWPALAFLAIGPIAVVVGGDFSLGYAYTAVINAVLWWVSRNIGDDEDHKKLKKKLKDKVAELSGRLVVVPETA